MRLLDRLAIWLGPLLLRALARTWRWRIEGEGELQALLCAGRPVLLYGWHRILLTGAPHFGRYGPAVLVSQSRDGEIIARIAEHLGWRPVRGSSSRGGVRGLLQMVRELQRLGVGAHLVDGPRGPARKFKPGLVTIAGRAGALLVPIWIAPRWRWEAHSWDRMPVPLPWSRVDVRVGAPVEVPARPAPEAAEALLVDLERRYAAGAERLERAS